MKQYIFPCILIACDLGAAVMCATGGDVRKTIYWMAAAVLSCTVTF